jgi:signal transduction histidine kinase
VIARLLGALGPGHIALQRDITVYGQRVGTLGVESDDASLLQRQWRSVRELLGLAAVMLLALDVLAFWVIGRALRPAAAIVAAVEQLGAGAHDLRLPALRPREFRLIGNGVNRLAQRLADANAARTVLTARLIRVQEDERRELAHELHEEFGQYVSALGAISATLTQGVIAGEQLTEADVAPLEAAVEQMLRSLRNLLQRMSQPPLEGQGLRSALTDLVTAWQIKVRHGPRIEFDADAGTDAVANNESALCLYRVVQECLNNIARHAPGSRIARIYVRQRALKLYLRVSNDLDQLLQQRAVPGSGMGLALLGERVRSLSGSFSVEVSDVEFAVNAELPVGA